MNSTDSAKEKCFFLKKMIRTISLDKKTRSVVASVLSFTSLTICGWEQMFAVFEDYYRALIKLA